jgi:hypothetical protein
MNVSVDVGMAFKRLVIVAIPCRPFNVAPHHAALGIQQKQLSNVHKTYSVSARLEALLQVTQSARVLRWVVAVMYIDQP